jgi:hypothetical protein
MGEDKKFVQDFSWGGENTFWERMDSIKVNDNKVGN